MRVATAETDGLSKPKQLMMKYPLQHQTAKFGIFLNTPSKKNFEFSNKRFPKVGAMPSEKAAE